MSTFKFETTTSTTTKGPKGQKTTFGGQRVAVTLARLPYKQFVAECREALLNVDIEALYHKAVAADLAPVLIDQAMLEMLASFDKSLANETPDPNYERVGVGLRRYVGNGKGDPSALYVSGVLLKAEVVCQGFGDAPAPKSRPLTLAKNLIKAQCGMGQWVQYILKGDDQDALKIEE